MTTGSPLVDAAIEEGAQVLGDDGQQWAFPRDLPFSLMKFPPNVDLRWAMQRYSNAVAAYRKALRANELPDQQEEVLYAATNPPRELARAQRPQTPQNRPQRPQGGQREEYPPAGLVSTLDDPVQWTCDKCHGTGTGVARRLQKGKMKSDAIVCLNPRCKEGDYRYTITFDEGSEPEYVDAGSLPFKF